MPVYTVTVVARTIKAVNYRHRSGSTDIDFRGTPLLPEARGKAEVESKQGVIKIEAEMERLQPATRYGPEYLTYVMWAITPEGRATNLGEVLLNGDNKSKLNTTTDLQSFGLIVTAEPYFAVTQPSDVVVMENFIRRDTEGTIKDVEAKYELLQRGQYTLNVRPAELQPMVLDRKVPLELYEARNAVRIARWTGAERYAPDTFVKAVQGLENAEGYLRGKGGKKPIGTVAREAAQMAEDARIITVKKMEEERLANERAAAADREARARADAAEKTRQAEQEAFKRSQAETERAVAERDAERAKGEAMRAKLEAEQTKQEAQNAAALAARQKADAEAASEQARQETLRAKLEAEQTRQQAQNAAALANRERADAEAARAAAQADAERARAAVSEADRLRQKAEEEKAALRAQLLQQLNVILETRDSARGLIVNMSDVLFDTAKYTLRPGAREKLSKISGIVLAHPGLRLEVEGHTDSVGGEEYNQRLSENRATAVRDYLVRQGVSSNNISARGFGKSMPVVSNDSAAGRQQNRRVELVVSGDAIGGGRLGPSASIPR